ncbi:MAG: serine/threonine protein kinase [Gemmatimonadota bacterium]|nr:MAG: serine/threonine protein kinase [Gemmatimonadota bacterium]
MREALKGRYDVERELARGGAARVFLARDLASSRPVALKVLHPQLAVSVTADRFLREVAFLSDIDHPKIGKLIDSGENEWLVYYVMSYVEGPSLRQHLARVTQASISDTLKIAHDLLEALDYAHAKGLVHRDVKPENVVLSPEAAVLVDFGIAKAVAESGTDRLTRSGFAVGTSAYMSPEQIEGAEDVDYRSDIYSLGCVLYECLAGRPPFYAAREEAVLRMHLEGKIPGIRKLRKDAPKPVAAALDKALQAKREDRWQSALEMKAALPPLAAPSARAMTSAAPEAPPGAAPAP